MTGVILVALYLVALSFFLGLDIISKVPPTLYALVVAALGALAAVSVVAGFHLVDAPMASGPALLGRLSIGLGAFAGVAGTVALGRLLGPFRRKSRSS